LTVVLDLLIGGPETSEILLRLRDGKGRSCLHLAAEAGNAVTVTFLLARGIEVNHKDSCGLTPLDLVFNKMQENEHDKAHLVMESFTVCEQQLIQV
jgi:ankyrin repeat protein